jgi:hypothetical protein
MKLGFIRVPVATYLEPIHFPKYWGFKKKKIKTKFACGNFSTISLNIENAIVIPNALGSTLACLSTMLTENVSLLFLSFIWDCAEILQKMIG